MPLCKKFKQIPSINFLDLKNLSLDCQCQVINRMSMKEFENELLCVIKKEEFIFNEIIKISDYTPLEIELSNGTNSKPKLELNEETINSIGNDKKENNESLLEKNLKQYNNIQNNDSNIVEEMNDFMSSETSKDNYSKENKKMKIIYISKKGI